ncbi:MAG TPA: SOS response-associated peptidase [Candidatus Ozemobacteraceae bacterium]
MCGRFSLIATWQSLLDAMKAEPPVPYAPREEIFPSQPVLILRRNEQSKRSEFTHVLWGFIPAWSTDDWPAKPMINARSETVTEKRSFCTAFRRRRCLIPATGWFEWKIEAGRKHRWEFHRRDGGIFAFAGLWECLVTPRIGEIETCAILTTSANELAAPIHDRMPCIIPPDRYEEWLGPGEEVYDSSELRSLHSLLRPPSAALLTASPSRGYTPPLPLGE